VVEEEAGHVAGGAGRGSLPCAKPTGARQRTSRTRRAQLGPRRSRPCGDATRHRSPACTPAPTLNAPAEAPTIVYTLRTPPAQAPDLPRPAAAPHTTPDLGDHRDRTAVSGGHRRLSDGTGKAPPALPAPGPPQGNGCCAIFEEESSDLTGGATTIAGLAPPCSGLTSTARLSPRAAPHGHPARRSGARSPAARGRPAARAVLDEQRRLAPRKGGKVVTIPLAPCTARAIDLAPGERCEGPIFLAPDGHRLDRHGAARIVPGGPPRRDHRAGRRRPPARCARCRLARRPANDHAPEQVRTSLDRHTTYIVAACIAGAAR
jgi:hypothetical protein